MRDLFDRVGTAKLVAALIAVVVVVGVPAGLLLSGGSHTPVTAKGAAPAAKSARGANENNTSAPAYEYHTSATLPATPPPAAGTVTSQKVSLSPGCANAVAPIRHVMASHHSGIGLDAADNTTLNQVLASGSHQCSATEWQQFQSQELLPWLRTPPTK